MSTTPSIGTTPGDAFGGSSSGGAPTPGMAPMQETEIVLGRRQMASVAFVVVVFLALVAGLSYLIGRASGTTAAVPMPPVAMEELPVAPPVELVDVPEPVAEVPAPPVPADITTMYATPQAGERYLQIGSVQRGVAGVMVQGLRAQGLTAIATQQATADGHKVLVGPFADEAEMNAAQEKLNAMDLVWFIRDY